MSLSKAICTGLIVLLAGILFVAALEGRSAGQSSEPPPARAQGTSNESLVRLSAPSSPAPEAVKRNSLAAAFESAAALNARLQLDLSWGFGGRTQRGWKLYTPIIAQMIGAEGDASTGDFAMALARWQSANGLGARGILDQETWSRMVSILQSRRIKGRTSPPPDQLVTAPASDFYDPSRPEELRQVERHAYSAYKRMVQEAAAAGALSGDERYLKIISAYRSREYQQHLRKQSPGSGRAALAVNSPHFTGRALDLYVGGEPVSTKDENRAIQIATPAYRWLVKNAARFGFQPYFYEPWHWEYVGND